MSGLLNKTNGNVNRHGILTVGILRKTGMPAYRPRHDWSDTML
jgi:hypothetical protein